MYTVYALKSQSRKYIYVGMTTNLEERIHRHNSGYEQTTKPYRPFELLYTEKLETREAARAREKYLKSGIGKDFLRQIN
ncbi:MAG TPA: GIY-YIG nuclease family protein [Paludibacter sp.]|nr:GIY-YIG nuclease family protein [Paludibacter sp.]